MEYVYPESIDGRIISRAAALLEKGALVAVPTDTTWAIVCSYASAEGVKRLRKIAARDAVLRDERHFTILCSSIAQLSSFCSLDNSRFRLIKRLTPGPYVFVLNTLLSTEKTLGLKRREAAVRIPASPLTTALIEAHGEPLYAVTAKRSMEKGVSREAGREDDEADGVGNGAADGLPPIPEEELFEGGWELECLDGVDLILDSGLEQQRIYATILDLTGDEARVLRQGAGAWDTNIS